MKYTMEQLQEMSFDEISKLFRDGEISFDEMIEARKNVFKSDIKRSMEKAEQRHNQLLANLRSRLHNDSIIDSQVQNNNMLIDDITNITNLVHEQDLQLQQDQMNNVIIQDTQMREFVEQQNLQDQINIAFMQL